MGLLAMKQSRQKVTLAVRLHSVGRPHAGGCRVGRGSHALVGAS